MSGPARTPRRPDASMTLLTTMLERPLDPGYAAAADRREAAGEPRSTPLSSPRLLVSVVAIGLVVGIAAYNLRVDSTPRSQARTELIAEIEERRAAVDVMTGQAMALQAEVTALQAEQAGDGGLAVRTAELSAVAGAVPLEGPGLTLTVDDAPSLDADDPTVGGDTTDPQSRIVSKDLQYVTNALWAAGAEAIAINGRRLTSTSAIRFAGAAIVVDYRPLARPYVVTALGDPAEFPAAFADGSGGTYLSTLKSTYGIRVDTSVSDDLEVPAAVGLTTRYATTGDTAGQTAPAGSTAGSQEGPSS